MSEFALKQERGVQVSAPIQTTNAPYFGFCQLRVARTLAFGARPLTPGAPFRVRLSWAAKRCAAFGLSGAGSCGDPFNVGASRDPPFFCSCGTVLFIEAPPFWLVSN